MSEALKKLIAAEKEAREFGFDWPNQESIINQIIDECREIREDIANHASAEKIQEEIGDLLHAAFSFCNFSGFDIEETLSKINQKFDARMSALRVLTKEIGLENLQGQSTKFMLALWDKAKIIAYEK